LPLPADCVVGGLAEITGRWFLVDPSQTFAFGYPQFEGSCGAGFRRAFAPPEDHDASDGQTYETWSDGTVVLERQSIVYQAGAYELTAAWAFCMLPDGTLAEASGYYDTDQGTKTATARGTRFAPRDELQRGLTLAGELGTSVTGTPIQALDLAIEGAHAYVAGIGGLDVVDISDPAAPTPVGHLDGSFNDVEISTGDGKVVAYLSPYGGGRTAVVEVTDPAAPAVLADLPVYSHTLFRTVRGGATWLYLAASGPDIPIFDVTHPLAPARIAQTTVPGPIAGVHDLFADGDRIYAANTRAGLVAFDVAAGWDQPHELGHIKTSYSHSVVVGVAGGRPIVVHGDEGMTATSDGAAFLRVLDGDPSAPGFMTEIGRYQSRPEVGIHNFQLVGDLLYIAYYQDGVRVIDLSDPTRPREVAHYNTWNPETAPGGAFEGALGVRVIDRTVYVADDLRGLLILRAP